MGLNTLGTVPNKAFLGRILRCRKEREPDLSFFPSVQKSLRRDLILHEQDEIYRVAVPIVRKWFEDKACGDLLLTPHISPGKGVREVYKNEETCVLHHEKLGATPPAREK